jgi:PAS domain-containing protein
LNLAKMNEANPMMPATTLLTRKFLAWGAVGMALTERCAPRRVALALALGMLAWGAQAQNAKLEEIERKINEQKAAKARAAEAARQGAAAQARLAPVVVQSDAACRLLVNGKFVQAVGVGVTEVRIAPGQNLVSCTSTEEPEASFEGELEARTGQNTLLRVSLAAEVASARRDRAAQAERRERERQEAEARARAQREFRAACDGGGATHLLEAAGSGELRQCGTGLIWAQRDNGRNVNWADAMNHCQGQGGGWRLPSSAELQSLVKAELPGVQCGEYSCNVSEHFSLSSYRFWSNERNGSSVAWSVYLYDGARYSTHVDHYSGRRALCVRRP